MRLRKTGRRRRAPSYPKQRPAPRENHTLNLRPLRAANLGSLCCFHLCDGLSLGFTDNRAVYAPPEAEESAVRAIVEDARGARSRRAV